MLRLLLAYVVSALARSEVIMGNIVSVIGAHSRPISIVEHIWVSDFYLDINRDSAKAVPSKSTWVGY
jgi:hypothetical protein